MGHVLKLTNNQVVGADDGLIAYIERHRKLLADTFPETAIIEEGDFNEVCFRALHVVGQLTTKAQPGTEGVLALKPGFVPEPEFAGVLAEFALARVRAIQTGASERFVDLGRALETSGEVPIMPDHPVMDADLSNHLRQLQPLAAESMPEFGLLPFEEFCGFFLPVLARDGYASETTVNGQSVWKATRRLRRRLRRING